LFSPAYAQDVSSPVPSQADFKALTDARIAVVKAALQLTPEQEKLWPPRNALLSHGWCEGRI
jgi:hypothetical protein